MTMPDSWQVKALRAYLRLVMSPQLRGLSEGRRASLRNVFVRKPEQDEAAALERILIVRETLHNSRRQIDLKDYGAGAGNQPTRRTVGSIHDSSAVPHWWGVFLFRLVRELKPNGVLELGTNLGVSGAYIQSALEMNGGTSRFTTIEGDPTLAALARETLDTMGKGEREVVIGRFQDALGPVLEGQGPLDLVFIDGHHEYKPTLDYFGQIRPFLAEQATIVFDDVYFWSRAVRRAWKEIVMQHPEARPIDLAKFGILIWS